MTSSNDAGSGGAPSPGRSRWAVLGMAGVALAAIGTVGQFFGAMKNIVEGAQTTLELVGLRSPEKPSAAPPQAPVSAPRLSIVVLPFANLSNEPRQDPLVDGITGDLTTDLSRISGSFVIARNTAFTYKGKAADVRQIGRDLGVRYVLEGSMRPAADQIRLNVNLSDATTGGQLWADRFDVAAGNATDVQDEITPRIAQALNVELINAEGRRVEREKAKNPDAIDLTLRGWALLNGEFRRDNLENAEKLFRSALARDSNHVEALTGLAQALVGLASARWTADLPTALVDADNAATRALSLRPKLAYAHYVRAEVLRVSKRFEGAIAEYDAAIALDRNLALAYASKGRTLVLAGRSPEAFEPAQNAIRLSPRDPSLYLWYYVGCHAHTHLGEDDAAIGWCLKSVSASPFWIAYVDLASAYAWKGQKNEASAAVAELLKLQPGYTVQKWATADYSDNPRFLAEYQRIIEGLRKAGLPEG